MILLTALVRRLRDTRAKSLRLFNHRVWSGGPHEQSGVLVIGRYEVLDSGDQLLLLRRRLWLQAGKVATLTCYLRDDPKQALYLVQP